MASRRSASGVAALSITAVQLSISFAGGALLSAAQLTAVSAVVWALAEDMAAEEMAATANAAVAAEIKINERMIGSWKFFGSSWK
jgi:hypothetical protein